MENQQGNVIKKDMKLFSALMVLFGALLLVGSGFLSFVVAVLSAWGGDGGFSSVTGVFILVIVFCSLGLILSSPGIRKLKRMALNMSLSILGILFVDTLLLGIFFPEIILFCFPALLIEAVFFFNLLSRKNLFT